MGLTFATKRRRRFLRWRTLVVLIVVAGIGAGAFVVLRKNGDSTPPLPSAEADTFLRSWTAGDAAGMASELDLPPTDLARMATSLVHARRGSRASYTRTGLVRDAHNAKEATATYHGRVDVNGFGAVEWDGSLRLVRVKQDKKEVWRIQYQPDILYPGLRTGQYLDLQVTWPARASILAADGSVLSGTQSVITVGLEPARVTKSLNDIKRLMQQLVGTDPASIDAALHAPGVQPNWFVPIATVADDSRYTTVLRPQLYPLPGLSFRRARGVLSTSPGLAPLVGRLGDITADRLKQLGAPYVVGDQVGLTGLQAAYETRLAGTPTADVVIKTSTTVVRRVQRFVGNGEHVQFVSRRCGAHGSHAPRGAGRHRRDERAVARGRVEARRRVRSCPRRHLRAGLDVQGRHVCSVARQRQHRRDPGAVPADAPGLRPRVQELRG